MKVRVADYIASHLSELGVDKVFLLSGGMMMHLMDTLGRENGLKYVAHHHEQASAMAADGYARRTGGVAVCYATSGPGATNIVTGLVGAWQESTPVIFLTGQSKSTQTIQNSGINDLRQYGTFEVNIVPMVQSVTKYAHMVTEAKSIRFHLEKALYLAKTGRPGPVLLDLPLDIQGAMVDPDELEGFTPTASPSLKPDQVEIERVISALSHSRRPLLLAGYGIRCAGAVVQFRNLAEWLGIPVLTTQLGKDVMFYDHQLFVGHPGPKGDRAANLAIQSADLLLSIGCSLHAQTTGWEEDMFAPEAVKIQVDLDPAVLARERVGVSHKIQSGSLEFITAMLHRATGIERDWSKWREYCASWKRKYPVENEPHDEKENGSVNFYRFADILSECLESNDCIVTDAGSAFYVMGQGFRLKDGQRFISSGSMGAMGFALPAANGAAAAGLSGNTVCVTGDGSLMTNLHELATLRKQGFNVKLFVLNNQGYVSIRNTQREFFEGHFVGADETSGVFIPSIESLAKTFSLPYVKCERKEGLELKIREVLAMQGPVLCEVVSMQDQKIIPGVVSVRLPDGRMKSSALHNMYPFLPDSILEAELEGAREI